MKWLSAYLFAGAFAAYLAASFLYIARITLRRRDSRHFSRADRLGTWALRMSIAGVMVHGGAIGLRWAFSGQAPMSNMFEYISLLGWSAMFFFVLLSVRYRLPALGAFVAPAGVIVIGYASVFPTEVKPLVPVLQSYWLVLHVIAAALGEGAFAVSFGAALMYLLRVRTERSEPWEEKTLEFVAYLISVLAGFTALAIGFKWAGYSAELVNSRLGRVITYGLPPIVGPEGTRAGEARWLGLDLPLLNSPAWMAGINAAKNLNTLVLSLAAGAVVYGAIRLINGRSLRELGSRAVSGMDPRLLDEVSYRGVALGFPLFTLGAIVFAMIWAQKAWGSYWSWDPKETWSLISWLFYTGYLHMRIVRGWEGRPAAWIAALGFALILFTLVGVNLLISGLHGYAG